MNSRLILTLVPLAGFLITGCDKPAAPASPPPAKTAEAAPPPSTPPMEEAVPVGPLGPTEAEMKSEARVRALELEQAELQQQLEEEKLARLEAELANEQALLDKERAAWVPQEPFIPKVTTVAVDGVQPADYASSDNYDYQTFYDDLAPYGTWYNSPDYGYCWQPSIYLSDVTWRPYTRGNWSSCDAGWAWCSDEPFGWACYHYGRWVKCKHRGWVWIPGSQWAPAWVCWRKNDNYVGWCPLPPETVYHNDCTWGPTVDSDCGIHPSCYVFVSCRNFDRRGLHAYCEVPVTCERICGSTVNVTNIVCRPGRVHCGGPDHDWITRGLKHGMPRYALAWESGREAHRSPAHRVEKDRLRFFAPRMETPWNAALRPRTRAERLENTEFVRASAGVPEKLVSRFRTERASREKEVTAPTNKAVRQIVERQKRLAELQQSRETVAADVRKYSDTVKAKLAAGPQYPEAPLAKTPRAHPVAGASGQPGGDVSAPAGVDRPGPGSRQPRPNTAGRRNEGVPGKTVPTPDHTNPPPAVAVEPPASRPQPPPSSVPATRDAIVDNKRPATRELPDNARNGRAAALEEQRRRAEQARTDAAAAKAAAEQEQQGNTRRAAAAAELQKRQAAEQAAADAAARTEAATREMDAKRSARAAQEERTRQAQVAAEQTAAARTEAAQRAALEERQRQTEARRTAQEERQRQATAAAEQQRQEQIAAAREASVKERSRQQESARAEARAAAMEQQRIAEAEARAEQAARQREELERQRAAMDQQRRQAEAQAQAQAAAREEAARREAMERQREAQEQQRRQAEENQRRAEEQASRQREAQENQRRQAEENQRRAAEENNRRQTEENNRRQSEQSTRQENDHKRGR